MATQTCTNFTFTFRPISKNPQLAKFPTNKTLPKPGLGKQDAVALDRENLHAQIPVPDGKS